MNFTHLNGALVHYKYIPASADATNKKTFLFINSLGTDFRIWDEVAAGLKNEGNILLFDKRGHGLSGATVNLKGLDSYVADAIALVRFLSIEKVIVVGLSIGGMIAQLLAYHHPDKVEKLILCDTRHKIGNREIWNNRIADVKTKGLKGISQGVMQRWFPEKFQEEKYPTVAGCQNMLERTSSQGYIQACEAIRDLDLSLMAKKLMLPTLCIVGSEDKSTPPDYVKNLADLIQGARFEVVEGSGHIPCVDNPVILTKLIIEFVNANKIG